jgi:hypothetical protein
MTVRDIRDAYIRMRKIDNTIPDCVLDFMKDAAIEKLEQANKDMLLTEKQKICKN